MESIINITGNQIALGPLRRDLLPLYVRWINDFASRRNLGQVAPQTLEQVGQDLGLSKERVRQVQEAALGKLRQALSDYPAGGQLCAAR